MKRLVPLLIFGMLMAACSRSTAGPHPPSQPDAPVTAPAVAQQPYKPGEKHQQALRLIDNQKFPAAETVLKQVVAEEPNAAEAWNDLSFVQAQLGRFHDSAASAKQALALKPGFSFAEYNLGWALLQTSDGWKDAKPHLDASAAAQPDRPEPYYALGLWYKYAGDLSGAQSAFQRGARLNYGPALGAQVKLKDDVAASASVSQVVARFPEAPVQVVWDLMRDYIQQGYTRRIETIIPVRLRTTGETAWAALLRDENGKNTRTHLQFQVPRTPDDYLGSCDIPGSEPVALQVLDYGGGQHVVIRSAGRTLLCGLQDRLVEVLFTTTEPVAVASDGVTVGGKPYRFVPELSRYLPGANANGVQSLIAEIRAKGYRVETDAAVFATLDLEKWGGPGTAFSWNEGVAFKPEAGPVAVYPFDTNGKREVMYPYPHAIGKVSVPGHAFLAVQTLQPGGPNGADVLVLEYGKTAGVLRPIFHDSSDGAGFHENSVFTASKHYLPQGGFETYVTDFQWDEKGYTFVRAETTKAGK